MLNIHRHSHAFARLPAIFSAGRDSTIASLFGPTIHPHFTGAEGNPSSSLPAESRPRADSVKKKRARFNDGRFRVKTEAKLRPLARFGCSMVWRLISAFRASVSRLKAELQRIATSRIAESVKRTMQRIVSVILPICVHLRNLRTRNLRVDSS